MGIPIDDAASHLIANRSRGTPRIANNLLRWTRDYAQANKHASITENLADKALEMLLIDHAGLEEMDKKILSVIMDHHEGGPVGLNNLAAAVGEEPHTLEEVYEPYLILQGFLRRTPRGREATELAYRHMGKQSPRKME